MKQGSPAIEDIQELINEPLHQYKGKHIREQKGRGINAQGEKKLITDYAFYEDIIVKLHLLKQIQDDRDQVNAPPPEVPETLNSEQIDPQY